MNQASYIRLTGINSFELSLPEQSPMGFATREPLTAPAIHFTENLVAMHPPFGVAMVTSLVRERFGDMTSFARITNLASVLHFEEYANYISAINLRLRCLKINRSNLSFLDAIGKTIEKVYEEARHTHGFSDTINVDGRAMTAVANGILPMAEKESPNLEAMMREKAKEIIEHLQALKAMDADKTTAAVKTKDAFTEAVIDLCVKLITKVFQEPEEGYTAIFDNNIDEPLVFSVFGKDAFKDISAFTPLSVMKDMCARDPSAPYNYSSQSRVAGILTGLEINAKDGESILELLKKDDDLAELVAKWFRVLFCNGATLTRDSLIVLLEEDRSSDVEENLRAWHSAVKHVSKAKAGDVDTELAAVLSQFNNGNQEAAMTAAEPSRSVAGGTPFVTSSTSINQTVKVARTPAPAAQHKGGNKGR